MLKAILKGSDIGFDEVFALVAKYNNDLNLVVNQMDLNTAFLNGAFDKEIYMQQSDGFVLSILQRFWICLK